MSASIPTIAYPARGAPEGSGTGVTANLHPEITWRDDTTMTWTTGAAITWIGFQETMADLSTPHGGNSIPTIAYTGKGE